MRRHLVAAGTAAVLLFSGAACDREDRADVREVGEDIEKGAEEVGQEVEQEIDELDSDGKDD